MDNFIFCLNATVPIFILMIMGVFFRKIGLFNENFITKSNKFVFTVALPVLLFEDISTSDFVKVWNLKFVLFCFCITFISIVIAFLLSFLMKDKDSRGEFVQASYRSSAALLGIAFIQNLYGNAGMAPLMIIGTVPLYNIMAVVILEVLRPGRGRFDKKLIWRTAKGVLTNPIVLGIVLGILWSLLKIPQPAIMERSLNYISVLATPLGLMAMGASVNIKESMKGVKPALACSALKLVGFTGVFLPLAVWMGFREDELAAILIMLGSATTVSCFIMAKNMGHKGTLTSSAVMITTFANAFTLTGWLFLLKTMNLI